MGHELKSFQFNNTSPRYIKPLFIHLQYGRWYSMTNLINILNTNGLNVAGKHIASYNSLTWAIIGLGRLRIGQKGDGSKSMFTLTELGRYMIDIYSTNEGLFYDLIHFFFYTNYYLGNNKKSGFWIYPQICQKIWDKAPSSVNTLSLTNMLQIEFREQFPGSDPGFNDRSVQGVFPWLQVLSPPFLTKNRNHLYSQRRAYCTPQLFHLATDLVYTIIEGVQYGTWLAISGQRIETICKACLLDPEQFWHMLDLTQMMVQGFEVRQGQWETSIMLAGPPTWITLPDFSREEQTEFETQADEGEE
jgi:hypothetical protein